MTSYTPFLRAKGGEFKAVKELHSAEKAKVRPFFDLPRMEAGDILSEDIFLSTIKKTERKFALNLTDIKSFYLDNKDISDRILIRGAPNYRAILDVFSDQPVIPVTGINRSPDRHMAILDAVRAGNVSSERVAIRLDFLDIEDYHLVAYEFESLVSSIKDTFENIVLIYDLSQVKHNCISEYIRRVESFGALAANFFTAEQTILTGSSIPASIADVTKTETDVEIERLELIVFNEVSHHLPVPLDFGDYTTVSPFYSGVDIPLEAMQNVTAPKLIYPFDDKHFIIRGGALRTHPKGQDQYYDLCEELAKKQYFRGAPYSYGDHVIYDKSLRTGSRLTPSHAVAPMVNAHITYMIRTR